MRKIVLFLLYNMCALLVCAVPAKRERITLTLADGTKVEATWMGDETMHFYQTDDGQCLQCDSLGIAHPIDSYDLRKRWKERIERRQAARASKKKANRWDEGAGQPIVGNRTGLVILVQFPDVPFHFPPTSFQDFFNEKGYKDGLSSGSVRDYFYDASYGKLDFTFDVVGPVTMSQPLSYYGSNNSYGDDRHPAIMVAEAVQLADEEVDFKKFDWDGDNQVDHIFIIHAGHDEAQSRKRNDIWSHAWTLTEAKDEGDGDGPVTADGVVIDSYATSSELHGRTNIQMASIGTACHEFSHCFGIPDFYDTQGSSFGMNSWSIMDYGCYNNEGGTPTGFTSYERMFCGWLDPIVLSDATVVSEMPALTSEPVAYILRNSGNEDEFYLFENRQQESWDEYLGGHGMLILHVDYDKQAWHENTVNTIRAHQRMTIIPADNTLYSFTLNGDPWPGASGKTEFNENSTPAATLFNENAEGDKLMHHSISEISESDNGLISFIFDEEALKTIPLLASPAGESLYNLGGQKVSAGYQGIAVRKRHDGKTQLISTKR